MKILARLRLMLTAMAVPHREALRKIDDRGPTLALHCMYLYLYPNAPETNHWCVELSSRVVELRRFLRIKGGKVLPTAAVVTLLVGNYMDEQGEFDSLLEDARYHMHNQSPERPADFALFQKKFTRFVTALCEKPMTSFEIRLFWA